MPFQKENQLWKLATITEETRKFRSKRMIGNSIWDNLITRKNWFQKGHYFAPWKGKKRSEEWKRNQSIMALNKGFGKWMIGKKLSDETIRKRSLKQSGKNHWNWNGGKTKLNKKIRESYDYRKWRAKIFERDNFTCILCKRQGKLNVDHFPVSYAEIIIKNKLKTLNQALNCKQLWDIINGRTLCVSCHKNTLNYLRRYSMDKIYRQGDVLIKEINAFSENLKETNDPILAKGEKTGHMHRLQQAVQILVDKQGNKFFEAGTETVLIHDEHKPIQIPKAKYEVVIQREYSPSKNRQVTD